VARRITVGMPAYRAAAFMPKALECLKNQTFGDFDAIISVDGSDRETAEACRPFLTDDRFRMVVQPERLDWFGNLNFLLGQELGDFFCYRQHDDTTTTDFFERLIALADAKPEAAIVYADCQWTGGRNDIEVSESIEGGNPLNRLLRYLEQMEPTPVRGLIRRDAVRQAGPVRSDEFRGLSEIFVWLAKVLRWGSFIRLPEPLYIRLDHADNYHKDQRNWPVERRRAAWTTMFTGMLEAIMPLCRSNEERLHAQQLILDRITTPRPGRPYLYKPGYPESSGRLIGECLARLAKEGNEHLLGTEELPEILQTRFRVESLRAELAGVRAENEKLRKRLRRLRKRLDRAGAAPPDTPDGRSRA
jgi:glycosyltransferase involved in cell wall biosynthesis